MKLLKRLLEGIFVGVGIVIGTTIVAPMLTILLMNYM